MRSVSEPPACLLCEARTELLYPSNVPEDAVLESAELACTSGDLAVHDDIYYCQRCELGRSVPADDQTLEELYRHVEDPTYFASEEERRAEFRRAVRDLHARRPDLAPGTLLEVGSSVGLFLDEARRSGWDVIGIEPSQWAAEQATRLGLEVFTGTLDEFDAGNRKFDVVASWDVWEHLVDPVSSLARVHELLKPGGLLVITTVNMRGLHARLLRGRWPWFMRMHLHYFTRASLTEMVVRAGFSDVSITGQSKTLKLGYLFERAQGLLGPLGSAVRALVGGVGLSDTAVRIDLGDIIRVEARKSSSP